jgi:hypothetical protein
MTKDNGTNKTNEHNGERNLIFPNLIPLLYFEYRTAALNYLKNVFLDNLLSCIKAEREYCQAHNIQPLMTQEKVAQIQAILDQCTTIYEIQALNDYVFIENCVPTLEEVKNRGLRLKLLYPLLEAKRPTKIKGQVIKPEKGGK